MRRNRVKNGKKSLRSYMKNINFIHLFGTDWPLFNSFLTLKEYVDGIKKMKLPPPMKMMGLAEFTEEEKNKILGENAKKLLSL